MTATSTQDPRSAISRARFFLQKAKACTVEERTDFEAYLEAAIIFARASMHRMKSRYQRHPDWKSWWDGLSENPAVDFLRAQRNYILKQAPPKLGQKVFVPSIGGAGSTDAPTRAGSFYFFEKPGVAATETIERHLNDLEVELTEAEARFA